jgi:hypothetical protein
VRFELTDPFEPPVFKTGAIDHSATLPSMGGIVAAWPGVLLGGLQAVHEMGLHAFGGQLGLTVGQSLHDVLVFRQ